MFKQVSLKSVATREAATLKLEDFKLCLPKLFEEEAKLELELLEKKMMKFDSSINKLNKEIVDLKEQGRQEEEDALD